MRATSNVIPFSPSRECFPPHGHSLSGGGMSMKVTHQHPAYTSDKERLERLQELKKACTIQLHGLRCTPRSA